MNNKTNIIEIGLDLLQEYPQTFYGFSKTPFYNDEPKIFQYNVFFKENKSYEHDQPIATGTSFSKEIALQKLFGELIERYSISLSERSPHFKKSTYKSNKGMLDPMSFMTFSNTQLKQYGIEKRSYEKGIFLWEKCKDIFSDASLLIPAQLIYTPYFNQDDEPTLQVPISSGAACGINLDMALYGAVCELIERDSFLISYLNMLPCPLINIDSINDLTIHNAINNIERYYLKAHIVDTTTDLSIFSICVIVTDETGKGPAISLGLKAGLDKKAVILGALEEALMTRAWIRDKLFIQGKNKKKSILIRTVEERALYWSAPQMISKLDFWLKGKKVTFRDSRSKKNPKQRLKDLLTILNKKKISLYYSLLANEKFKKYQVSVVKVVSPELQPMYLDEKYPYFGKKRLLNTPQSMGYSKKSIGELNKIPHPFL